MSCNVMSPVRLAPRELLVFASAVFVCVAAFAAEPASPCSLKDDPLRPQLRFTQRSGWANDPNGLVFRDGTWHFFHQHNPGDVKWGPMYWNHAVSKDLVHWTELGDAIVPDALGTMFSGSAVVDRDNTAGFGKNAIVLIYTAAGSQVTPQKPFTQCLAYSLDGRTFTKYSGNPVVPCIADGGCRDPKVFWHGPTKRWVMPLYGQRDGFHVVMTLTSPNLKDWTEVSSVRGDKVKQGDWRHNWLYECPGLEEIKIEGETGTAWVLWGATCDYAVGSFDGKTFTPQAERLQGLVCNPAYTPYYAAQTYGNVPDGRTIWVAWFRTPYQQGAAYSQTFGLHEELTLRRTAEGLRLVRRPVRELDTLRKGTAVPLEAFDGELAEVRLSCNVAPGAVVSFDLRGVPLVYDASQGTLSAPGVKAPWKIEKGTLSLIVYLDRIGMEVFSGDGLQLMPVPNARPDLAKRKLSVKTTGLVSGCAFYAYPLRSVWD